MALTNRARASTAGHFSPIFPVGIRPTGELTQLSRQAAGWGYAGVLAQGVVEADTTLSFAQRFDRERDRRFTEFYPSPKGVFDI